LIFPVPAYTPLDCKISLYVAFSVDALCIFFSGFSPQTIELAKLTVLPLLLFKLSPLPLAVLPAIVLFIMLRDVVAALLNIPAPFAAVLPTIRELTIRGEEVS